MKLRTQISLFLFLFGLVPLLVGFVVNVPMIFDRIEGLYHKAHLQNLRAEFGDLDQHIARRHETVRLLAKTPEPGMLLDDEESQPAALVETARTGYVEWVNRVLVDQLDITQVLFLDGKGALKFGLDRNSENGRLEVRDRPEPALNPELVAAGQDVNPGVVLTGPIQFDREASVPTRFMQLSMVSPVTIPVADPDSGAVYEKLGMVVVYLDMSGLTRAYRGNYWVQNDGRYLGIPETSPQQTTAFSDFHGLEELFGKGELALWEYEGQQVLWVPLFRTEGAGPLWVGRSVDPSPIAELRSAIEGRIVWVAVGLLLVVFVVARLIAVRTERLGRELTDGISRVLERDEAVSFSWRRPQELHALGANLTRLAETHVGHSRALHAYADQLEASNRYKSEFLANVSHELRTPLNSILLLSKMIADSRGAELSKEERRQARVIYDAGTDLKALIDNILDLSRIEAGKMALVAEPANLESLVNEVLELLKPQFDEKHLELELVIDPAVPATITTDAEKLRQILINFLSNAVKFTEQGGVQVRIGSITDQSGVSWPVGISVRDTGIGIPAEKLETIFEAFKQADGSTSRRFGGTGLGLTISRDLAEIMGGRIEVDSTAGSGSTFTLLLPEEMPVTAEGGAPRQRPARHETGRQEQPVPLADYGQARVLLVDDDVRNLLAMTQLLEHWQLEVMAAGDGEEALETLESDDDFQLVFMDIMMPEMDGYEVIKRVRDNPRFAGMPIVALTAKAGSDDLRECMEAGANDCIVKPVDTVELKAVLDRHLAEHDAARATAGGED